MGINYYLGHFAILSSLFPLFSLVLNKKVKKPFYLKIYILEIFLANFINLILFHFTSINQDYFFWFNLLFETILIGLIFFTNYDTNWIKKILVGFLILSLVIFLISTRLELSNRFTFYGTYSRISITILSIIVLIQRYYNSQKCSLFEDFLFNFSSATIMYAGLQLYVIIFNNIIMDRFDDLFPYTWPIIQLSSIIHYFLIVRALWKLKN
jgi:hypothetical protein